jgi:hypothetical protein
MKPVRIVIVVVVGLVLVAGALFFLGSKRGSRIEELQKQAQVDLHYKRADAYFKGTPEDKAYVDALFVTGVETARKNLGGFFTPPPDENKYYTFVYQAMIDEAKQKGKTDLAKSLHKWVLGRSYVDVKF